MQDLLRLCELQVDPSTSIPLSVVLHSDLVLTEPLGQVAAFGAPPAAKATRWLIMPTWDGAEEAVAIDVFGLPRGLMSLQTLVPARSSPIRSS